MTRRKKYRTNRLFHRTSLVDGAASVFNIQGNYYNFNYSKSGTEADMKAIENDWGTIGNDILVALNKIKKEIIK